MIDRRMVLGSVPLLGAAMADLACARGPVARAHRRTLPPLFDDIEKRTFRFFWDTVNRKNGLSPDRWPTPDFSSIASVGFALTAYAIGVERGWCARAEARDLTLTTLRFFWNAPQGPDASGVAGHKGFFYHFLNMETGLRHGEVELSTVDSSLLFMGMLFAAEYYDRDDTDEREIRRLARAIYARADWAWFEDQRGVISMGWHPGKGRIERGWDGYNEGKLVVILGMGAPEKPMSARGWDAWTAPYPKFWRGRGTTRHIAFAPLFGHQYSEVWIDFRGIRDKVMRAAGFDYFENSRRATYANRAYCIANPMGWRGYSRDIWGLSACDGPGGPPMTVDGRVRQFFGYAARGPQGQPDGGLDDGTIAPTAALASLPFAPEIVIPCAEAMHREYGARLYGDYGFFDSFNPSFVGPDAKPVKGSVDAKSGWVDNDYLGIDQGPIVAMIANYRDDFVWKYMRRSAPIRRGLQRAGFTGGWLAAG